METSDKLNDEEDLKTDVKNFNLDKANNDTPNKMEIDTKPPGIDGNENAGKLILKQLFVIKYFLSLCLIF